MVEPIQTQAQDFDKLPNEKQEAALNFLAITESDKLDVAVQYLEMSITLYMDHSQQPPIIPTQQQQQLNQPIINEHQNIQDQQEIENYQNYLIQKTQEEYYNSGLFNGIKSMVTGVGGLVKNTPLKIRKPYPGGEEFYNYLSSNFSLNFSQTFNFQMGQLEENLNEAYNMKQPLIVFIFTLSEQLIDIQLRFLKELSLIPFINQKFRILGLLSNSDQLEQISSEVPLQKWPCLAIFRKNLYERRELIQLIEINEQTYNDQNILNQLKESLLSYQAMQRKDRKISENAHKNLIRIRQQQQQMFREAFQNELFGFDAPPTQESLQAEEQRRIKIQQDRLLREQQEENLRSLQRKQEEKQEQERIQAEQAQIQKELEIKKREERLIEIAQKRQSLPIEPSTDNPDTFIFQFRMPDGQKYFWKILANYSIQILFDFIETHEEINQNYPEFLDQFDLIQTIPFLSLQDKKNKIIQDVFQDSRQEILYIKKI